MMLQRVRKFLGINPPQPQPGERLPYKYRRGLKKAHARTQRRNNTRMTYQVGN